SSPRSCWLFPGATTIRSMPSCKASPGAVSGGAKFRSDLSRGLTDNVRKVDLCQHVPWALPYRLIWRTRQLTCGPRSAESWEDAMTNVLTKIHRRVFVSGLCGGAAVVGLANVARAQTPDPVPCRLGPPPHEKGPRVWMDMDQIEIDASYDQRFY